MTTQEFSEQFDTLYNQQYYMMFSMQNPVALDEYEKSLFLTEAQRQFILTLYGRVPNSYPSFERTEEIRRSLGSLVVTTEIDVSEGSLIQTKEWVKTPLSEISPDDVFVFVGNNGGHYAMSNNNGNQFAPDAVPVDIAYDKIVGEVPNNIKWRVEGNEDDGYIFYPMSLGSAWLCCLNSNNGVRVATEDPYFQFIDSYLFHVDTSRYVGIYTPAGQTISQSWRCYTSNTGTSNIAGQTLDFYMEVDGEPVKPDEVTLTEDSLLFDLPEDLWFITYEAVKLKSDDPCLNGKMLNVVPVTQDEFYRINKNPFRGSNERRALRLDIGYHRVELVSKYDIEKYLVRYIKTPHPIILVNLQEDDPSIEGHRDIMECELNPAVHRTILEEAVKLALASKTLNTIPTVPQPKESKNKDAGE